MSAPQIGTVTMFDQDRAIGVVTLDDGAEVEFHSTALSDRSRVVAIGTRVAVEVAPWHSGSQHCREVVKL